MDDDVEGPMAKGTAADAKSEVQQPRLNPAAERRAILWSAAAFLPVAFAGLLFAPGLRLLWVVRRSSRGACGGRSAYAAAPFSSSSDSLIFSSISTSISFSFLRFVTPHANASAGTRPCALGHPLRRRAMPRRARPRSG